MVTPIRIGLEKALSCLQGFLGFLFIYFYFYLFIYFFLGGGVYAAIIRQMGNQKLTEESLNCIS